ncbi:hypothetical protein AAMO2058_000335400 [Amorphochlora amoebiformis]
MSRSPQKSTRSRVQKLAPNELKVGSSSSAKPYAMGDAKMKLRFLVVTVSDLGDIVTGKVTSGELHPGSRVKFKPSGIRGRVVDVMDCITHETLNFSSDGDVVQFRLKIDQVQSALIPSCKPSMFSDSCPVFQRELNQDGKVISKPMRKSGSRAIGPRPGDMMALEDDQSRISVLPTAFNLLQTPPTTPRVHELVSPSRRREYGPSAIHIRKGPGGAGTTCPPVIESIFRACEDNQELYVLQAIAATSLKKSDRFDISDMHPLECETLAHVAARNQHVSLLKSLLAVRANPNARNSIGQTVLHAFVEGVDRRDSATELSFEIVNLCLSMGAKIDARSYSTDFARTALITACSHSKYGLAEHLIDCGSDVTVESEFCETALSFALEAGPRSLLRQIIEAYPESKRSDALETALELAADMRRKDILQVLYAYKMQSLSERIEKNAIRKEAKQVVRELNAHMTISHFTRDEEEEPKSNTWAGSRNIKSAQSHAALGSFEKGGVEVEAARDYLALNQKYRVELHKTDKAVSQIELDLQKLRAAFLKADQDEDGFLSPMDLKKTLGSSGSGSAASLFFRVVGAQVRGVTWERLVEAYVRREVASAILSVPDYFHSVDKDGDGRITKTEFRESLVHIMGKGESKVHCNHLFNSIDRKRKGYFTLLDLKTWSKRRESESGWNKVLDKLFRIVSKTHRKRSLLTKNDLKLMFDELTRCAQFGRLEILKRCTLKLKKYRVVRKVLNKKDKEGNPLLFHTLWKEQYACMEFMIDSKADVNAVNLLGNTILHNACRKKDYRCMEILIRKGADPYIRNKRGQLCYQTLATAESKKQAAYLMKQLRLRNKGVQKSPSKVQKGSMPDYIEKQYKTLFDFIDDDNDGYISQENLKNYLDERDVLFIRGTGGSNNRITWEEFKSNVWLHIESRKQLRRPNSLPSLSNKPAGKSHATSLKPLARSPVSKTELKGKQE